MTSEIDTELEIFSENVHFLRTHYGYTKKAMANILKISTKSLNILENGTVPNCITASVVFNITKHFKTSASMLFTKKLSELYAQTAQQRK